MKKKIEQKKINLLIKLVELIESQEKNFLMAQIVARYNNTMEK